MKEETKSEIKLFIIIIIGAVVFFASIFAIPYWMGLDDERIIVEGIITDVEIIENVDHLLGITYDRVKLTFDNNESYIVKIYSGEDNTYDFTHSSKFIIRLFRPDNKSDWIIQRVYKVPD